MRGTFFKSPFECQLLVSGETWSQGESVSGVLQIKARDGSKAIPEPRVYLAYGLIKKVQAKAKGCFKEITPVPLEKKGDDFAWTLRLDINAAITDVSGSLYLLYGFSEDPSDLGFLQLQVVPTRRFADVVELLETSYRFVTRHKKFKKGFVEVKFMPPAGKATASIEQLHLLLRMEDQTIQSEFHFDLKKIDATSSTLSLKKVKKVIKKDFLPSDYLSHGHFNHERMVQELGSVMGSLKE